jgi:beta-mannanase
VDQVRWVWCPHVDEHNPAYTDMMQYYPGDDFVDWIGMDAYNAGCQSTENERKASVDWLFKRPYQQIASKQKPVMVAEIATDSQSEGAGPWIKTAFEHLQKEYPQVRALVYFDMDYRKHSPLERDWRFSDKPELRAEFGKLMKQSEFAGNKSTLLNPFQQEP